MDRDLIFVGDVVSACRAIEAFRGSLTREQLLADDMIMSAIIRKLEIVGEATKRISFGFRAAHPGIPWQDMAGMRDCLIHGYDEVDFDIVWKVITEKVPFLVKTLERHLPPQQ